MPLFPVDGPSKLLRRSFLGLTGLVLVIVGCGGPSELGTAVTGAPAAGPSASAASTTTRSTTPLTSPSLPTTAGPTTAARIRPEAEPEAAAGQPTTSATTRSVSARPEWLGSRVLPTTPEGEVVPQTTPVELEGRALATIDTLPPPAGSAFEASIEPLAGEPLARSTWHDECPVTVDELRYVQLVFWGFDETAHRGELIVNRDVAEDVVGVFRALYDERFPIEEMRIVEPADVDAPPTGDGNNTTSFVCRAVVGGTRYSEHAYGLAIDINPFQNPYRKGEVVLPELATSYLDRADARPGMFRDGGPVVSAFDEIGWGWGGRWSSIDDYHHFALNDR